MPPPTRVEAKRRNGSGLPGVDTRRLELAFDSLPPPSVVAGAEAAGRVYELINAYRVRGHLFANLNPLEPPRQPGEELELETSASRRRPRRTFPTINIHGLPERATLREIIAHLAETYCRSIGVEYTHLEEPEMRAWLHERMESTQQPR